MNTDQGILSHLLQFWSYGREQLGGKNEVNDWFKPFPNMTHKPEVSITKTFELYERKVKVECCGETALTAAPDAVSLPTCVKGMSFEYKVASQPLTGLQGKHRH